MAAAGASLAAFFLAAWVATVSAAVGASDLHLPARSSGKAEAHSELRGCRSHLCVAWQVVSSGPVKPCARRDHTSGHHDAVPLTLPRRVSGSGNAETA